jgi:uncharacterized membrane protein YecN with MAPEG domain
MFSKVSHVGWISAITLAVIVAALVIQRRTQQTIVFADGTTAEIKRN